MSWTEPILPVFVYGTLRPHESNYHLLQGYTLSESPATADGLLLYSLGSYPMVIRSSNPQHIVAGNLMTIRLDSYAQVMPRLDWLEEYNPADPINSLYQRVQYPITLTETGLTQTAWIYIGQNYAIKASNPLIEDGDWVRFRREYSIGDFAGLNED